MSNQKRAIPKGERWAPMILDTMEQPAWGALSTTAQALYPWLKLEWRGPKANNNGNIQLSVRQAAQRLGVTRDTAAEAFRDLQRKGFIVQTAQAVLGIEGAAKSACYEITEIKMPASEKDGRKLYRDWQPGNDFPCQRTGANNPSGRNGRKKPCHVFRDVPVLKTVTNSGALS
ncbi:hypothetical protein [Rhizobium sp. EC-SD404]|uniref:hypothetical protein n=1 Tax=Rhizobium sp. EC-SD404 TaxID=2038389 RepID=UPI00125B91CD|nr:hypothetical protein [Rhizobium sp. EC-SD404]VVT04707.1 conserved hypothetical protein [Rhizobium sp. EC-SD404]